MALGDDGDFRMVGFRQVMRFPPQDVLGGTGSVLSRDFTTPFGGNIQQPGSWSTSNFYTNNNFNQYTNNSFTNNATNNTINNYYNCDNCGGSGPGGSGGGTISVVDSLTSTTYSNISTLNFSGSAFASAIETPPSSGTVIVTNNDTGGGGGGSTLEYGEIVGSAKIVATEARWAYQVEIWNNGNPTGTTVTAYNTLERGNISTLAYGYTVNAADGQSIPGTVYKVQPIPTGAFVVMEDTDAFSLAGTDYWFSAPNRIDGTCT